MKKNLIILVSILLAALFVVTGCASNGKEKSTNNGFDYNINYNGSNTVMRDMTTTEFIQQMGLGINLGNTFEATGRDQSKNINNTNSWIPSNIAAHETAWGSPRITKRIIQGYKAAGFDTLRIPVAWSNLMDMNTYDIHPDLLNRVQEIVDWTLESGMYAVVNLHWDGGWIQNFPTNYEECMKRYTRIWEQVAGRFKDYGDYLLFESQNEELGFDSLWNKWGGTGAANMAGKTRAYELVNEINQTFVDLIRASGGNNPYRHLLIAGYHTNIDNTCDPLFKMPNDPVNRIAIKVHYYDPFGFTHLEKDESWGKAAWTWGTQAEVNHLNSELDKMVRNFTDKGIPVAIGEYGMAKQGVTQQQITNYTLAVTKAMISRGMLPMLWCVQLQTDQLNFYYNRRVAGMTDSTLEKGMKELAASR
jgi:endoglucanase